MNSSTLLRLAGADLRTRPGRALLPGLAVLVGVACLIASWMLSHALLAVTDQETARPPSSVALQVSHKIDMPALDEVAPAIAKVPGISRVLPVQHLTVEVVDAGAKVGSRAHLDVEPPDLRSIPVWQGAAPAAAGEIAVDRVYAHRHDLRPGSTVTLIDAAGKPLPVRVSGITERGASMDSALFVGGPELATRIGTERTTTKLNLQIGTDVDQARQAVQAAAGGNSVVLPSGEGPGSSPVYIFVLFSILALATSVVVAVSAYRAVYLYRQRTTALLRCVGGDRRPLVLACLIEAMITGLVSGLGGALAGGVLATGLAALLDATGVSEMLGAPGLEPSLLPSTTQLLTGAFIATVLCAGAALLPALAASKISPLSALRDSDAEPTGAALTPAGRILGLLSVGGAMLLALAAVAAKGSSAALIAVVFSAIAMMFGLFWWWGPVTVPFLARMLSLGGRIGGPIGRLATAEIRRMPARSAAVARPLAATAALLVFSVVLVGTGRTLMSDYADRLRSDVEITDSGHRGLPDTAVRAALLQPGVQAAAVVHSADGKFNGWENRVAGVTADQLTGWYRAQGADAPQLGPKDALLSRYSARELTVGQEFTVTLPGGPRTYRFAGEFDGVRLGGANILTGDTGVGPVTAVAVRLLPGTDPAGFRDGVHRSTGSLPTVRAVTTADEDGEQEENIRLGLILFAVLLGFSVLVAVAGIGIITSLSVAERRRELGLRRALGITRSGLRWSVIGEGVLLALAGTVGGGLVGTLYAGMVMVSINQPAWPTIPWGLVGTCALTVLALAAAASALSARAAARITPATALASG
ncbi:FtsX-like permease family protein [Pseudonocardiaceae bacterium YIM PH 21723]|nr:FtsX-like permease family protein [Pseudonocardiaceae bacterium YIM PH 21723]